jgi:Ca-activated chloride channel homolog
MISITIGKPVFMWLLLVLPLFFWLHHIFLKHSEQKAMNFSNFMTLKRIAGEKYLLKNTLVLVLRLIATFFLILAMTQTTIWYPGMQSNSDFVLAIDTSASMSGKDILPSRLDFAKDLANDFIFQQPSTSKIGLVSFSGTTYIDSSLSEDKYLLSLQINELKTDTRSGTDLANAIITATNVLIPSTNTKEIIIFTDGSNTVTSSLDNSLNGAIEYAKSKNVKIHTIGIGTQDSIVGYLPELYGLKSSMDEDSLKQITNQTNGYAVFPKEKEDADLFFEELSKENRVGEVPFKFEYWGLLFCFMFLLIEWLLVNTKFRRII